MSHTAYRSRPSGATLARLAGLLLASAVPAVWGVSPAMAQDGDTVLLDRITLEGASYETDDSDSYTSGLVSVGEKDVLSVREIPQSTSVLTRERIEDGG